MDNEIYEAGQALAAEQEQDSRRWYLPDGTSVLLATAEEVIERRKSAVREFEEARADKARLDWLESRKSATHDCATTRAAIDTAMAATTPATEARDGSD